MADEPNVPPPSSPPPGDDPAPDPLGDLVPIEDEDVEAPRRAASAEFDVESQVGSQAMLREAMDPANQSLAEALRLSFRVLQGVILVLIVLFIFSGFQDVKAGNSGVLLRWGRILERGGQEALVPGLRFSKWPYPVGEFVIFDVEDRETSVGNVFWPELGNLTLEQAVARATTRAGLRVNRDGMLLTNGGDIAHMRLDAIYDIEDPAGFVRRLEDRAAKEGRVDADRLVALALARATVHHAATRTVEELVDMGDGGRDSIARAAQSMLDDLSSGIRITKVETPDQPTPALAIKKAYGDFRQAEIQASELVETARQMAGNELLNAAGKPEHVERIVMAIDSYEQSAERDDDAESEIRLREIFSLLDSDDTSGEARQTIAMAKAYRSTIEQTLGYETSRFQGILAAYRANPELTVGRLWYDTYGRVMGREDAEIFYIPEGGGSLALSLAGLDRVRQIRRERSMNQAKREAYMGLSGPRNNIRRLEELRMDRAGRQLDASGRRSLNEN